MQEINSKWLRNSMSGGVELPLKTFHNHRKAIEEIFDINIACDRKDGYRYYIENSDDLKSGGIRAWLLNTFAVNNLINESQDLKGRILLEDIPSGQKFLTTVIESMAGRPHPPHDLQELLETRRVHRGGRAVFHQDIPAEMVHDSIGSVEKCAADIRLGPHSEPGDD